MKYMVMECHPAYAVVLDPQGRFLKVANQNFEVGQSVSEVMELRPVKNNNAVLLRSLGGMAACICLLLIGAWQMLIAPYGTVRVQINPDVKLVVNRIDYVTDAIALNEDGEVLLASYDPRRQKVDEAVDAIADSAEQLGYLKDGGEVKVTVESKHEKWKTATEERLVIELQIHTGGEVNVSADNEPNADSGRYPEAPAPTAEPDPTPGSPTDVFIPDDDWDDDEDDDDDWDDDDDDDWDEDDDDDWDDDDEDEDDEDD